MTPLTASQAAEALADIDRTEARSREAWRYAQASPHLLLWGLVWVAGYGLSAAALPPPLPVLVWPLGILIGALGSALLGRRTEQPRSTWRGLALGLVLFAFFAATYTVLPPRSVNQMAAFPALLVALGYCGLGLFGAPRLLALGLLVGAVTMLGYLALPALFLPWMALCGGGTLLLGGALLRRL